MWSALGPRRPFGSPIERQAGSGDLASAFACNITVISAFLALEMGEAGEAGETGETEVVSKTAARTPLPTHAGGQDDGSYTNSLKLYIYLQYIYIIFFQVGTPQIIAMGLGPHGPKGTHWPMGPPVHGKYLGPPRK